MHTVCSDQIHLHHLPPISLLSPNNSVCFYCLNFMFTKFIYCHMYVHRCLLVCRYVSSPSEPESLKTTDILPQQGSTVSTSSERGRTSWSPLHPRWDFGRLDPVKVFCMQSQPVRVHMLFSCRYLLALPLKIFIPTPSVMVPEPREEAMWHRHLELSAPPPYSPGTSQCGSLY